MKKYPFWWYEICEQVAGPAVNRAVRKQQYRFREKLMEVASRTAGQRYVEPTAATRMFIRTLKMSKAKREHQRWRWQLADKESSEQKVQEERDYWGCHTPWEIAERKKALKWLQTQIIQIGYSHWSKAIRTLAGINPIRNQNRDMILKDLVESLRGKDGPRQCGPDGFDDAVRAYEEDR